MNTSTANAVIAACALVVCALLALIGVVISNRRQLLAQRQDVAEIRDQVTNSHSTNLREENDERHAQNVDTLSEVKTLIRSTDRRNGRRFASVGRDIKQLQNRLGVVEDTMPHPTRRTRK